MDHEEDDQLELILQLDNEPEMGLIVVGGNRPINSETIVVRVTLITRGGTPSDPRPSRWLTRL